MRFFFGNDIILVLLEIKPAFAIYRMSPLRTVSEIKLILRFVEFITVNPVCQRKNRVRQQTDIEIR